MRWLTVHRNMPDLQAFPQFSWLIAEARRILCRSAPLHSLIACSVGWLHLPRVFLHT